MLVFNKLLHKTDTSTYIRFCQVKYHQSGVILILLKKNVNAEDLVKKYFNILIRATRPIDEVIIGVKVIKY